MKTLLYGGAFDPPHKSHINTAITALSHPNFKQYDTELWFLPCYSDAFGKKKLSPIEQRIAMLEGVYDYGDLSGRTGICLKEYELSNNAGSYAVIKDILKTYPDREFYYVIGTDQANRIRRWRHSRELLKTIPFVVVQRNGLYYSPLDWYHRKPHIYIEKQMNVFIGDGRFSYNSTEIRDNYYKYWKAGVNSKHPGLFLHTHMYIRKNGLYTEGEYGNVRNLL